MQSREEIRCGSSSAEEAYYARSFVENWNGSGALVCLEARGAVLPQESARRPGPSHRSAAWSSSGDRSSDLMLEYRREGRADLAVGLSDSVLGYRRAAMAPVRPGGHLSDGLARLST